MARDDDNDRFEMPESAFASAWEAHRAVMALMVVRVGMYVPTRLEVRAMSPDALEFILDCWMGESPVELIPSEHQITEVIYELERREDRSSPLVQDLIDRCQGYVRPMEPAKPLTVEGLAASFRVYYAQMKAKNIMATDVEQNSVSTKVDSHD